MTDARELDWMIGEGLREIHRRKGLRELVDLELYMGGSAVAEAVAVKDPYPIDEIVDSAVLEAQNDILEEQSQL